MIDRTKELFGEALELPTPQRTAFLAAMCGDDATLRQRLETLLRAHDAAGDFLAHPTGLVEAAARAAAADDDTDDLAPGQHIGNYELLEPLGRGGFGSVWRARQRRPVERDVALKVLTRGHDGARATERFLAERQLLARMEHPGVAKVFDAGAMADGRPWLAMELVDGEPITRHCTRVAMPLRWRLELFIEVCQAVQHAHQKGVVHRDLKPSNVLVTSRDGRPHPVVIDFGVAAAWASELPAGGGDDDLVAGTPEYMSPEQAAFDRGAVDVRTDVHALGVLLYELLCGERPFVRPVGRDGQRELLRRIREDTPAPPSQREGRQVPRELDWIVAKALRKDPADRYANASALADDVRRALEHHPVVAGPDRASYRLRKFVRRNRLVAATVAAVLIALGAGMLVATRGWQEARRAEQQARADQQRAENAANEARLERDRAARQSTKANRALDLLDELWSDVDTSRLQRVDYPVQELLAEFERGLAHRTAGEPEVELRLRRTLARLQNVVGRFEQAEGHATRALDLASSLEAPRDRIEALLQRSRARFDRGELAASTADAEAAIATLAQTEPDRDAHAMALELIANCRSRSNDDPGALAAAEQAMALREQDGVAVEIARSAMQLARLHGAVGRIETAMEFARRALQLLEPLGEDHPQAIVALQHLAFLQQFRGDRAAAEVSFREGLRRRRQLYGEGHPIVAWAEVDLGWLLHLMERPAEAAPLMREALPVLRERLGERHLYVSETMQRLGAVLNMLDDFAGAEKLLREAIDRYATLPGHPIEGWIAGLGNLAMVQWRRGEREQAIATQRLALQRAIANLPRDHYVISVDLTNLGMMLYETGDRDSAAEMLHDALQRSMAAGRTADAETQRRHLRTVLRELGRDAEADALPTTERAQGK